jgi:phosphatidylserine/phosphatidylglycerophosphate/cardiolipin synthase-like enzyme
VCITELYYDTHPNVRNEFVAVCNPTSAPFDLSGWYVSDEPLEPASDQAKVLFGRGAFIPAHTTWYCTQNASWYLFETGALPTFEYYDDARADVPQLERHKTLTLSNSGGAVALHDPSGAIADVVCYGNFTEGSIAGWNGSAVEDPGQGIVLRRAWAEGVPKDTDTASDWAQPRIFHIGQSTFGAETFVCNATCIPFVSPDCSFPTIVETLRAATRSVLLNVYEFTNPWLARELLWLLHRNVSVSVLLDGSPVGGISADEETIATVLASAGASVRFLANDPSRQVFTRYRFDHAKYLVVDATTVVVMSGNWGLTGVPVDPSYGNREWGVAIVNATVASYFTTVFTEDFDPTRCDSVSLAAMNFSNASDSLRFAQNRTGDYFPRFPSPSVQGTVTITPILSPDTSETLLCAALASAKTSLYIEQLELALEWKGAESPLVCILREKAAEGVDVRVLLNENPAYEASASITVADIAAILEGYGIQVRRSTVPWSPFATLHNKGAVIDNRTVLVSSINWNANSVQRNREAAVLIDSPAVAGYYAEVFCSDWDMLSPTHLPPAASGIDYKNLCLIVLIVGVSATLVGLDWRRRRW